MKFIDNAVAPICAFDFDGTINCQAENTYPICGVPRAYSAYVLGYMRKLGIKIIIWTSRGSDEHIRPMVQFLNDNKIGYDSINSSFEFAPYAYESRKIYAHMYVDDRGFGWNAPSEDGYDYILFDVLEEFLFKICGFSKLEAEYTKYKCIIGESSNADPEPWMIQKVKRWNCG